jgi:hypothetical protein
MAAEVATATAVASAAGNWKESITVAGGVVQATVGVKGLAVGREWEMAQVEDDAT